MIVLYCDGCGEETKKIQTFDYENPGGPRAHGGQVDVYPIWCNECAQVKEIIIGETKLEQAEATRQIVRDADQKFRERMRLGKEALREGVA